jgi:hypothetical protein
MALTRAIGTYVLVNLLVKLFAETARSFGPAVYNADIKENVFELKRGLWRPNRFGHSTLLTFCHAFFNTSENRIQIERLR